MTNINKTIWMAWFQGENDLSVPELNRECIKKWRNLNTDWQVNILSEETISNYVPEYHDIVKNSPPRSFPARSDLLRILLLSKLGGVWVDASLYPMLPLEDFIPNILNDVGFFTYRFIPRSLSEIGNRETVSWFLCVDRANHPLINLWKKAFVDKFQNLKTWKYFTFHETLCELYDNDNQVKFIIDNMVQIDAIIPHSASKSWENKIDSYMYKRPNLGLKKIHTQYRVSTEYGHPYKFVYFVIHKNGTRSIFNLFNFKQEGHKIYDPDMYKDYFTWTMVRNPWDRLVSAYKNKASKKFGPWSKFENLTFSDFIYNKEGIVNSHTCIQHTQIPPDIDFIGKMENFQEDFNTVCDKIGIPRQKLPHKNASKHKHYTEYYDEETKQIVAEKYAKDIEYFGYKFGE